ncbi:adhesion G-protein coupled receptor G2-like [Strongylocentrotus purpuratus]|uniref:Uncharacterized protein n=1 Tax=Strongylocentrotus purpuratus TaxID=7668 RepID=A0A7M7N5X0_STRPU|nr:adhesion G-protein coupled receptor G2-like [Strongylocentrotus purpuratus]
MFTENKEDLSSSNVKVGTHQDTPTETIAEDTFARVVVPIEATQIVTVPKATIESESLATQLPGSNPGSTTRSGLSGDPGSVISDYLRIVFLVYVDDVMFPSPTLAQLNQESEDFNRTVNTPVVSLVIGGRKIEHLMEPINITFSRLMAGSRNPTCNFWEYSLGKWSRTGCELLPDDSMRNSMEVDGIEDEYYTCSCDHLTNFAVLVDIYAMEVPPNPLLRVSSIAGCTISCVCLLITLISYLSIKRVRSSQTHRIFICLCVTLLCLYSTFLVIVALDTEFQHAEVVGIPCIVLAALVHYFVLSSITWMGIEGFHTYLVIIRVFDTYIPKFMIKAAVVGWGIPAVIVGLTGGIARNSYAVEDYCFIHKWSLIDGLLVPMAIILLVDTVIFILAIRHLKQSARKEGRVKKDYRDQRQETLERIQNGIAMLILLGFTWITGYLTLINVDIANTLFIISNSLLGFFIFALYCLRKATIRERWRRILSCGVFREDQNTKRSSGPTPMNTNGTTETCSSSEDSSSVHYSNPSYAY